MMDDTLVVEPALGPVDTGHDQQWCHFYLYINDTHYVCGEPRTEGVPFGTAKCPDCVRIVRERGYRAG